MTEQLLKKLRRLDGNMRCVNCDKEAPRGVGFGHVCVKYKTFICDLCKTSHQAISHRVKSVSTSNWTMEEVQELTPEHGGGNDAARRTILANAPEVGGKYRGGTRPKDGDKVDIYKQFVIDAYEYGKFKGSVGAAPAPSPAPAAFPAAPAVDLLGGPVSSGSGGASFDAFGEGAASNNSNATPSFDAFGSGGDPFASSSSGSGSSGDQAFPSSGGFDAFSSSASPPASVAADPFSGSNSSGVSSVFGGSTAASDPFGSSTPTLQAAPMAAPPMGNMGGGFGTSSTMQTSQSMQTQQQSPMGGMGLMGGHPGMGMNQGMGMQGGMNNGMGMGMNQGGVGMQGRPAGMGMGNQGMSPQMGGMGMMGGNLGMGMQQGFAPSPSMGAMGGGIGVNQSMQMGGSGGAKTGMFSPGGAAVGGQGGGMQQQRGQPSVMRPNNALNAGAIGNMDLSASLASTINAKNGGMGAGGSASRGTPAPFSGKDSFDFVQGQFGKR